MDPIAVSALSAAGAAIVGSGITGLVMGRLNRGTVNTSDAKTVLDSIRGSLDAAQTEHNATRLWAQQVIAAGGALELVLRGQIDSARQENEEQRQLLIACQTHNAEIQGTLIKLHAETTAADLLDKAAIDAAKLRAEARSEATKVIMEGSAVSQQVLGEARSVAVDLMETARGKEASDGGATTP